MQNKITQIVLLGGGYVSIWAYRSLVKKLRRELATGAVEIIVVCPEDYHFFHGWTAESLTGIIRDQSRMSPLVALFPKANIIKGSACQIDADSKTVSVKLKNGLIIPVDYDHLLIGTGSHDSKKVEGISQYGYQAKSHAAFVHTREAIQATVRQAAAAPGTIGLLSFTIAGSGFTGIELAANIAEFVHHYKKDFPSLKNVIPVITLVNSKSKMLDETAAGCTQMRHYAEKIMAEYGIELLNNKKISKISADGAFLDDGSFIKSAMVISAIGQSRIIIPGMEAMQHDRLVRLYTNEYLQVSAEKNIWGGGDACSVINSHTKTPCIPQALWAIKHGSYAGRNIAAAIQGKQLHIFNYKGLGQCASLGIGKGMGELHGIAVTGWIAWILRWFVFNYFMPSKKVMWNEISDWLFLLLRRKRRVLSTPEKKERRSAIKSSFHSAVSRLTGWRNSKRPLQNLL